MEITKWDDLFSEFVIENAVEEWLWKADIAAEVSSETTDLKAIARSLFGCIEKYSTSKEIQYRSYQLLRQISKSSDDSLEAGEESSLNANIVTKSLRRWISHTDIVSTCFQYLAIASEKKSINITVILPFDLLQIIFASLKAHRNSTIVQQPGTQIVLNLLSHTTANASEHDERILHKSIGHVIYNLQFQGDDFLIVKACCSSLENVVRNTPLATIAVYTDDIVALTTETFNRYYTIVEVASACLAVIDKLAVEERHLRAICPSSVQLLRLCETMQIIKTNETYQQSFLAACSILRRLVNAECVLAVLLDADDSSRRIFIRSLKGTLAELFTNIDVYYSNTQPDQQQQQQQQQLLSGLSSEILSEVDSWLKVSVDELLTNKSKDEVAESREVSTEIESGEDENKSNSMTESIENRFVSVEVTNVNAPLSSCPVVLDISNSNSDSNVGNGVGEGDGVGDGDVDVGSGVQESVPDKPLETAPHTTQLTPPPASDASMMIKVVQESQSQADLAIRRSDILHSLFIEAAEKMEVSAVIFSLYCYVMLCSALSCLVLSYPTLPTLLYHSIHSLSSPSLNNKLITIVITGTDERK